MSRDETAVSSTRLKIRRDLAVLALILWGVGFVVLLTGHLWGFALWLVAVACHLTVGYLAPPKQQGVRR